MDTGSEDSDDETEGLFWESLEFIAAVLEPCYSLMRLTDSSAPLMGKFYKKMSELGGQLEDLFKDNSRWSKAPWLEYRDEVVEAHTVRWEYMHCDYHGAGYALDPNFLGEDVNGTNNGEPWQGLEAVISRHYYDSEDAQAAAIAQYADYRALRGAFAGQSKVTAKAMAAHEWWDISAGGAPELRKVAMLVLSKTTSASACERNWSAFSAVQTPKRNRLHVKTTEDLVHVRVNLRLQQKHRDSKFKQRVAEWIDTAAVDSDVDDTQTDEIGHATDAATGAEASDDTADNIIDVADEMTL